MKNICTLTLALFALLAAHPVLAQMGQESPFRAKADSVLALMSLEEKIGQLNLPVAGDITTGQAASANIAEKIKAGQVGGLFNVKSAGKIRDIQRVAAEDSQLGIPMLFGMDIIHGYESMFPIPLGLSCSWDTTLISKNRPHRCG